MAKASPMVRSFNAGEFSALLEGRVDLDRYPSSLRRMLNYVAAPQGPAIGRSGTAFVASAFSHTYGSVLVPFVFSNEQARVLEFATGRIRFFSEDSGLQTYAPVAVTVTSLAGVAIVFTSATLGANIGDQVALSGFPSAYLLNGETATITNKVGTTYTLDILYPAAVTVVSGSAARVYHVDCDYTSDERQALRVLQSVDVMYLTTGLSKTRKLSRFGDYDWRIEDVNLIDGPFMPINETTTKLTPSATGNVVTVLSSDTGGADKASGSSFRAAIAGTKAVPVEFLGRDITYSLASGDYYKAFDDNDETYWASNTQQTGELVYEPAVPFAATGYVIYAAKDNQDTTYASKDYAPSTFTFEGWNGSAWVVLDVQEDYVLYDGNKSVFFEITNAVSYSKYKLKVAKLYRNGLIEARVRRLVIRAAGAVTFNLTASSTVGINNGTGFQSTDVGRLVRLKGDDGTWRTCEIATVASTTVVGVTLTTEPLLNVKPVRDWRLGYWSDTTGWPNTADFFDDKLWLAGSTEAPDMFAGSVTGAYETFSQTDPQGTVLDDAAIVGRLNARRLSRIQWLASDTRGMLIGTGSEEYTLSAPSNEALTARNAKARRATRRGSSSAEPVQVDNQILYVQRGGRAIREFAFVFEADGYKSPSMSQLASHFGMAPVLEMVHAQEPHSIVWMRRADGVLIGLTYNREENVIGWHQHDLAGGYVESITVIPQSDGLQDALWLVVRRTVNGQTRRYIERLTRFWDFDTAIEDAHYVDCGLRYEGVATRTIYGLQHLEGEDVYGIADAKPFGPLVVTNGSISLPYDAENIVAGLGFDAIGELPRLENGAADGTAQGKVKRIHSVSLMLWRSFGGEFGVYNEQAEGFVFETLKYPGRFDEVQDVEAFSGVLTPFTLEAGYDLNGFLAFRRPKSSPLPLNITAVMPQMHTQDR